MGLIFLPETPRYLIKAGQRYHAAQSLSTLRRLPIDHPTLQEELREIETNLQHELELGGRTSYTDFLKWHTLGKRVDTGSALQALQQLTGVNFIFYYGTSYFKSSGIKNPFIISIVREQSSEEQRELTHQV